jgi:hypothetical protein
MMMKFRLRAILAIFAACIAAPVCAQEPLDIVGRWKEIRADIQGDLKIGTIEFTPCGENMCGIRIDPKGNCGVNFIEAHLAEAHTYTGEARPHYTGISTWRGRSLDLFVWRHSAGIRVTATEGRSPFSRVPMSMLQNNFERIGEARCKPPVS